MRIADNPSAVVLYSELRGIQARRYSASLKFFLVSIGVTLIGDRPTKSSPRHLLKRTTEGNLMFEYRCEGSPGYLCSIVKLVGTKTNDRTGA